MKSALKIERNNHKIYKETLQHNPFGPWNWHVISTTDIEGQIMDDKNYYDESSNAKKIADYYLKQKSF